MLRHKALIQCARLAFGFAGIYDQDEAERFVEADAKVSAAPYVARERPKSSTSLLSPRPAEAVGGADEDAGSSVNAGSGTGLDVPVAEGRDD